MSPYRWMYLKTEKGGGSGLSSDSSPQLSLSPATALPKTQNHAMQRNMKWQRNSEKGKKWNMGHRSYKKEKAKVEEHAWQPEFIGNRKTPRDGYNSKSPVSQPLRDWYVKKRQWRIRRYMQCFMNNDGIFVKLSHLWMKYYRSMTPDKTPCDA